jgi:hypothetical protein
MSKRIILRGHTSPETAYVVNDYPYGSRLRCKIRYWLEKRHGRGYRLMSQTSNPKVAGEVWNKPKASNYRLGLCFMFLDERGHVQWTCQNAFTLAGKKFVEFANCWSDQFNDDERLLLVLIEKLSRQINPNSWAEYDAEVAAAAAPKVKNFTVASVSSNENSFGLTGVILVAPDGEAFEAATYAMGDFAIRKGESVALPVSNPDARGLDRYSWVSAAGRTFEIPRQLDAAPADVLMELFKKSQ